MFARRAFRHPDTHLRQIERPPDFPDDDVVYPSAAPFLLFHLAALGVIWAGVTVQAVLIGVVLYVVRMIAVTGGYHRYFSHRTFKTSRVGQFALAFLCQSSAQRGVIWWAAKHRAHHKYSDTPLDPHSPGLRGFWFAHVGWIFSPNTREPDYDLVPDLTKYPELRWLDRQKYLPAMVLAVGVLLAAGWSALFVGFFASTVFLYHGTFVINSLAHMTGRQRYITGDDSRNSWWLALLTFGEGWHNNHHYYQSSMRQGFRWYEIDVTYYVFKVLALLGLVWDLKEPPESVVAGERRLGQLVIDKAARRIAASVPVEVIVDRARWTWPAHLSRDELTQMARETRERIAEWERLHLPHVPTAAELKAMALEMYRDSPSLDEVVERARIHIVQAVSIRLLDPVHAGAFAT
ncbi:MAG TPA: acyl-CoA desaturase [Gemmatimonadales bacterium]|jgi:stearoyl-CoA desaturase (delta-9 desaturase)